MQGLKEDIANYISVLEQEEDASEEIGRLTKLGYVIKVPKKEIEEAGFKGTTVSKLGLIVKKKEDGSTKRRIIIDLKRSGGNNKAYLPERLVLPRPVDAIAMMRRMHASHNQETDPQEKVMELVMIDISDAYMHLAAPRPTQRLGEERHDRNGRASEGSGAGSLAGGDPAPCTVGDIHVVRRTIRPRGRRGKGSGG